MRFRESSIKEDLSNDMVQLRKGSRVVSNPVILYTPKLIFCKRRYLVCLQSLMSITLLAMPQVTTYRKPSSINHKRAMQVSRQHFLAYVVINLTATLYVSSLATCTP